MADGGGVLLHLVQVMGQRALVVEEFGIHGPAAVRIPQFRTQQFGPQVRHHIGKELARHIIPRLVVDHIAEPFIRCGQRPVVRLGSGRKPALVDAAADGAESIVIARVQLDASPGNTEERGTQVGARRSTPSPCSIARFASLMEMLPSLW